MSINLEGLTPSKTLRFGGQCDWDDPVVIPNGLAIVCQNMQFLAESVKGRWGQRIAMALAGLMANPTGLDVLTVLGTPSAPQVQQQAGGGIRTKSSVIRVSGADAPPVYVGEIDAGTQVGLVFTSTGNLLLELPAGTGALIEIPSTRMATSLNAILPQNASMQTTKAYNRIYQAYVDFMGAFPASAGPVLALDAATGYESPVGQNPIAAAWQADTFYQQGDIVTPVANPSTWFRCLNTGYSGPLEPSWPAALGYFAGATPEYAIAEDPETDQGWQEWTMGVPTYLPTPSQFTAIIDRTGFGTIASGKDVYVCISYGNDLGESIWTQPFAFINTAANDELTCYFGTGGGPPMPSWLMSVIGLGTTAAGLHWPPATAINVYVGSVAHGGSAPTNYYGYGSFAPTAPIVISRIPSGTALAQRTVATGQISAQQFLGEGGTRNAILLRQNTMGDLSPVDPRGVVPVNFPGGLSEAAIISIMGSGPYEVYVGIDDITQVVPGMQVQVSAPASTGLAGTFTIDVIYLGQTIGSNQGLEQEALPAGVLYFTVANGLTPTSSGPVFGLVSLAASPCPVAVVPPGVQEGPGYSYDIVAFTVVGLGTDGPFNYLASVDPETAAETTIIEEGVDGLGNGYGIVASIAGFAAGDTVVIAGWPSSGGGVYLPLNGQRTLAAVNGSVNTISFPDNTDLGGGGISGSPVSPPSGSTVTMTLVQTQPTQAASGTVGILLQFDDTTLPEGVDVTGNLLFVAVPPCVDMAYLPSVDRMAYVSDQQPTTLIFSEASFMGEVDGLNDVLQIEASNGSILVGARELLNGMIIACKRTGGYQVVPTADVPANWGAGRLWGIHGPQSGRNIATGRDGSTGLDYLLFVDPEAGLFKWPPTLGQGELDWLSKELSGANNQDASRMATWDRVNRAAGAQIQVVVDDIAKEVKIAVPLDGATTPSHILTMSYFNGWQDPLMLTLSGEWVANRQSRRWNIDPIATQCMAMVQRTLATPVDQRVNYHQLLLGIPATMPSSYATVSDTTMQNFPTQPTIPIQSYYAQLAKVVGGAEVAWSPVLGPFAANYTATGDTWQLTSIEAILPGDELEDSWNLYFGSTPTTLDQVVSIPNNVESYVVSAPGTPTGTQPTGNTTLTYMQPGVYDDLGAGYVQKYRPAYTREAPNQEWPAGGRYLRFSACTGHVLGAGDMTITAITDDPNYQPVAKIESLDEGSPESPGSAPVTHFQRAIKADNEFLTCEFSNNGEPGSWFQLLEYVAWYKALRPTR